LDWDEVGMPNRIFGVKVLKSEVSDLAMYQIAQTVVTLHSDMNWVQLVEDSAHW
jgi:hypothetical protein